MDHPQPNILLITTDQQRFDTIPPHAPDFLRTPHLTNLQQQGTTFDRAYADNPICVPSRTSIMTGLGVSEHGMLNNGDTSEHVVRDASLPSLLAEQGYQTAAIGKMHFSPTRARHGFGEMLLPDDYYDWVARAAYPLHPMSHGLGQNELEPTMATVPEGLTLTSWIADQSMRYVRDRRDPNVPFFLWTSFSKPHPPLDPPEPYYSMYRDADIPEPVRAEWNHGAGLPPALARHREREHSALISHETLRAARAAYLGLITQIDYNIGRILAALQDRDLLDSTLIVFTSDHGEMFGDHGLTHKCLFYDHAARIPFVVRPPRSWGLPGGRRTDAPVTLADLLPTLTSAAGRAMTPGEIGRDLIPLLRDDAGSEDRRILGMSAGYDGDPADPTWIGVVDQRWKYLWYVEGGVEQLFDLVSDPLEQVDLAADPNCVDRLAELREATRAALAASSPRFLEDGELPLRKPRTDDPVLMRGRRWPGYHTETFPLDVKH